jgi:hypothetical protein
VLAERAQSAFLGGSELPSRTAFHAYEACVTLVHLLAICGLNSSCNA